MRRTEIGLGKAELPISDKLVGHLTFPLDVDGPLPAVIYLHAYVDSLGHASTDEYGWAPLVGERLAQAGFLAVEYDQFGYGRRNRDAGMDFFARHPHQSVMGEMIQDVRAVVDALYALEMVDSERIFVAGYSLGGAVGLYAAVFEPRIRAVASTCGMGAMRLDAHGNQTEGLKRYSHLRPTLPRLGFFIGHERRLPYDFHEVLAAIAPRPLLILAPSLDQDWFFEDVEACCTAAAEVYRLLGAGANLRLEAPLDFNRYPATYQDLVNHWLAQQAELA